MSKRRQSGEPTNDLIFSSHVGDNSDVFPLILSLYVPPGSVVADVTYGRGVFWRNVPAGVYTLLATDLQTGVDCRQLPYPAGSVDAVVFDPPYMHTPGGSAHAGHQQFEAYYANNAGQGDGAKYHEAVLHLYLTAAVEAARVLRADGVYILKCQDEVCANRQRLTHVEIIEGLRPLGFAAEDLFVLTRRNRPGVSRLKTQAHARKNHSYFLVFLRANRPRWKGIQSRWRPGEPLERPKMPQ